MISKKLALTFTFLFYLGTLSAQENRFFMPLEIKSAYENGTRSRDGFPGKNYWQNDANYQIEVAVKPSERLIKGSEVVTYYNNSITVPPNYTVWATGELTNPEEVLNSSVYQRYKKALLSEEVVHVISREDIKEGLVHNGRSWKFSAKEVTDLPGVAYPYPEFTIFIGLNTGGTVFPMMANNPGPAQNVTVHEMFHTYFPMYVRINERKFAWMDEGWANYITQLITDRYFLENKNSIFIGSKIQLDGLFGSLSDLPLMTSSQYLDDRNYAYASYPLPQFFYSVLHKHLGDETFLNALQVYIKRWVKKSPTPYDFFYTFEDVSGEDLSWLWKPWFFNFGYADVSIF